MLSIQLGRQKRQLRNHNMKTAEREKPLEIMDFLIEIMVFSYVITSSLFSSAFPEISYWLTRLLVALRIILFIDAIVIISKIGVKKKDFYFMLLFPFIFLISYIVCSTWELYDALFIALYLSKKLKYDHVIKVFLRPMIIALGLIVLTYFAGMLPMLQVLRVSGALRFGFGFRHPNDFSRTILFICFLFCLKWRNSFKFHNFIVISLASVFVYVFPNSRDVSLTLILLLLLIWLSKSLGGKKQYNFFTSRNFKYICYVLLFLIISAMWLFLITHFADSMLKKLGDTFFARFYYGRQALSEYGLSLFGHDIRFVAEYGIKVLQSTIGLSYFTIDSAYFYMPIARGIIPSLFVLWVCFDNIKKCFLKRDAMTIFVLICMMIYSVSEPGLMYFSGSFLFILPRVENRAMKTIDLKK